jgi:hypothetical protein
MIYGHLGVLQFAPQRSKLRQMICVNYNQPVSELFTQVARYMISARGSIEILSHVEDLPLDTRTKLPTWVPDCTYAKCARLYVQTLVVLPQGIRQRVTADFPNSRDQGVCLPARSCTFHDRL